MDATRIQQLVEAALERATSLDLTNGGKMPAESLQEFVKTSGGEAIPLIEDIRAAGHIVTTGGDTFKVPTLGLATRQLQKATAETAPNTVATLTASQGEVTMTEVMYPIDLDYNVIEDAIGKNMSEIGKIGENAYLDKVVGDLALKAFWLDLQDLMINGDTHSGTPFLTTMDGVPHEISAHGDTYAPGSAETIGEHLTGLINDAAANIQGEKSLIKIYMNTSDYNELEDLYGARNTPLGDAALTMDNAGKLRYKGVLCKELSQLADQKNLLCHEKAIWLGMKRDVSIERWRNQRKRILEITMTARIGWTQLYDFCVYSTRTLS